MAEPQLACRNDCHLFLEGGSPNASDIRSEKMTFIPLLSADSCTRPALPNIAQVLEMKSPLCPTLLLDRDGFSVLIRPAQIPAYEKHDLTIQLHRGTRFHCIRQRP